MKLVIEVDFTNSGKLGSVGSQWSVWVFVVCLCVCVRVRACVIVCVCACVRIHSHGGHWSEVPTRAHMANDKRSVERQRHKECEFISVALTELIVRSTLGGRLEVGKLDRQRRFVDFDLCKCLISKSRTPHEDQNAKGV